MKKIFALFVAVAFTLSLAVMAVAADEKKAAPAPAAPAKAEPAKKEAAPAKKEAAKKAKAKVVTGTIEALDAAAGTFSVKGKKETVQLKAGQKVKLGDFKVGDKVTATYADGVASKVVAAKKAAPKKEAAPAKKEAAPAKKEAAPAPAAPAKK